MALGLLLIAARARTYHEPFMGDITVYAVIAHEMQLGRALYAQLIDHKPPGLFVSTLHPNRFE